VVIKKIRASIFGLQQPWQTPIGLRARVMEIIDDQAPQLGFTASAIFTSPPGPEPDETLAHDILAVTREALSNCARHAGATAVTITLKRQDGLITLDITDNGRSLGTPTRSGGLASMRRAENNGGNLHITAPQRRHAADLDRRPAQLMSSSLRPAELAPRTGRCH
jgi:signal transduction histidine kinase